jgi:hypothetical protein
VLRWAAADTAAGWKACTKKLSAISRQLSVGSKAPLARAGPFLLLEWQPNNVIFHFVGHPVHPCSEWQQLNDKRLEFFGEADSCNEIT